MPSLGRDYPGAMASAARVISSAVAGAEGLGLLGYAASIAVVAVTSGIAGPAEVSSPSGVVVEIVTFALLGAGLVVVAVGRWRGHGWATIPFVVAQLLALTVGVPLATGATEGRAAGYLITAVAVLGLVSLFLGGRDPAWEVTDASSPQERDGDHLER